MINIKEIDMDTLGTLAGMYLQAKFFYNEYPEKASIKNQKKICKFIKKTYFEHIKSFSEEIQSYFKPNADVTKLLSFLKECYVHINELSTKKKAENQKNISGLDASIQPIMERFLSLGWWESVEIKEEGVEIVVNDNYIIRQKLFLYNAKGICDIKGEDFLGTDIFAITRTATGYRVQGKIEKYTGEEIDIDITFSDVKAEVEIYNATHSTLFAGEPWDTLQNIANQICIKARDSIDYCNDKEKQLLPLLEEICNIQFSLTIEDKKYNRFPILKTMLNNNGYKKLIKLFDELEKYDISSDKYRCLCHKIFIELSLEKYEDLWRKIWNDIEISQEGYVKKAEAICKNKKIETMRSIIQKQMEEDGFEGVYPIFSKKGKVSKIRLEESYGMSYFIFNEKRARYKVRCIETIDCKGNLCIQFLGGVKFCRKKEKEGDIYSCSFNAKGRRLFFLTEHFEKIDTSIRRKN